MSGPLFSESEVGEIMRRAAELQESGSSGGYVPGVTSDELARIATEIGISPKFLEQAVLEKVATHKKGKSKGGVIEIERIYPVEIDPENFDVLTENVKIYPYANWGQGNIPSGGIAVLGKTLTSQVSGGWAAPFIKIVSRDGRTKLRVSSDASTPIAMACISIVAFVLSFALILINPLLLPLGFGFSALLGNWLYKYGVKKTNEAIEVTAGKIEQSILEHGKSMENRVASATAPLNDELSEDLQNHIE